MLGCVIGMEASLVKIRDVGMREGYLRKRSRGPYFALNEKRLSAQWLLCVFYHECRDINKSDLVKISNSFMITCYLQRYKVYVLSSGPENNEAKAPQDFRPISLVTSIYKIIAFLVSSLREFIGAVGYT